MITAARYRKADVALIAERSRSMGLARAASELEAFLPLSDAAYVVMLSLATPRASDRGFVESIEKSVDEGSVQSGALVTALERLVELGLLAETVGSAGERYQVTELGDAILSAETGRRNRKCDLPSMPTLWRRSVGRRSIAS